jgi:hypothetical protein
MDEVFRYKKKMTKECIGERKRMVLSSRFASLWLNSRRDFPLRSTPIKARKQAETKKSKLLGTRSIELAGRIQKGKTYYTIRASEVYVT